MKIDRERLTQKFEFGFTLVELLVVFGVLALLLALLFPAFGKARDRARTANCSSNLRQLGLAMSMYLSDHSDVYPPISYRTQYRQVIALSPYLGHSQDVFICPSARGKLVAPDGWPHGLSQADHDTRYYNTLTNNDGKKWVTEYKFNDNQVFWKTNEVGEVISSGYGTAGLRPIEFFVAMDGVSWAPRHGNHTKVNMAFLDGHVTLIADNVSTRNERDLLPERRLMATYTSDSLGSYPFWNWGFPEKRVDQFWLPKK